MAVVRDQPSVFYLLLSVLLLITPKLLKAQQCPNSPSCNAVVGSVAIPNTSSDALNRVLHVEAPSPDGVFNDELFGFSYNRSYDGVMGIVDDHSQPAVQSLLESYWNGQSELNIDMIAPNTTAVMRPFGFTRGMMVQVLGYKSVVGHMVGARLG